MADCAIADVRAVRPGVLTVNARGDPFITIDITRAQSERNSLLSACFALVAGSNDALITTIDAMLAASWALNSVGGVRGYSEMSLQIRKDALAIVEDLKAGRRQISNARIDDVNLADEVIPEKVFTGGDELTWTAPTAPDEEREDTGL